MGTINISLPDDLEDFVDERVAGQGFLTSDEYVRALIRKDRDRQKLRALLLEGASSEPGGSGGVDYFDSLRWRVRDRAEG